MKNYFYFCICLEYLFSGSTFSGSSLFSISETKSSSIPSLLLEITILLSFTWILALNPDSIPDISLICYGIFISPFSPTSASTSNTISTIYPFFFFMCCSILWGCIREVCRYSYFLGVGYTDLLTNIK